MTEPDSGAVDDPRRCREQRQGEACLRRTPHPSIGLALSGGGVRATLFSLGVAIALIDTGANRWVRSIASVSGGSLLNAWLAHAGDFSLLKSPGEFEAGKLAKILSRGGVFTWRPGQPPEGHNFGDRVAPHSAGSSGGRGDGRRNGPGQAGESPGFCDRDHPNRGPVGWAVPPWPGSTSASPSWSSSRSYCEGGGRKRCSR